MIEEPKRLVSLTLNEPRLCDFLMLCLLSDNLIQLAKANLLATNANEDDLHRQMGRLVQRVKAADRYPHVPILQRASLWRERPITHYLN